MAKAGFYNTNQYRDYPFLSQTTSPDSLPSVAICDFGAIMEPSAAYDDAESHYVYLHSLEYTGGELLYDFRTNAPDGALERLLFTRDPAVDDEFAAEWVDSTPISGGGGTGDLYDCNGSPSWRGFLVTGSYAALVTNLAGGPITYSSSDWRIGPARIQNLAQAYVRSISVGNFPRTHTTAPGSPPDEESAVVIPNATCLEGALSLQAGYNCTIRQENLANTFVVGAASGEGDGTGACEEIPLYSGETGSDLQSPFLSGGPGCHEIIKTINGKGGRRFQIRGGDGINVTVDDEHEHTIIVDRDLSNFAVCNSVAQEGT